eukprot:8823578-Ditylum_brightwellii.AAC.1
MPGMEKATEHKISAATLSVLPKDINQEARFCAEPKASHEVEVKHVIRYLLTTQERNRRTAPAYGLNMIPDMNRGLEVYVDASFAGEWNSENSEEPTSVLSRTG